MKNILKKLKVLAAKSFEHVYYWLGVPDLKHDALYEKKYLDSIKNKSKHR